MNIKNFVLSYYINSAEDFHIHKVEKTIEAQKPHTHEYFQIYYVTNGNMIHYVKNRFSALSRGDMFIIPPDTEHHISPEPGTVFYSFSFMPEFLGATAPCNKLAVNFLRSLQADKEILPKVSVNDEDIFYVENIMNRMLSEFKEKKLGHREIIHSCTILLVMMLARNYFEKGNNRISGYFEDSKQYVMHCINYIENNFTEQITLDEISKRSAMSKSNFCTVFSRLTGHSFNDYLNICRIKKAAEYIKNGYKITAVYGLCGYSDFSTFYRNFKKIMGISPREYKNSVLN